MTSTDLSARLRFLNDSAHLLLTSAPETSRFLMLKRNALALEKNIDIMRSEFPRTCEACGAIMLVGWHGTAHIESQNDRKRQRIHLRESYEKQPRTLVYECNICHEKSRHSLQTKSLPQRIPTSFTPSSAQAEEKKTTRCQLVTPKNASVSSSSQKRKKTKKNTLEAIMKQKKAIQTTSPGYDLMDFMRKS